MVEKAALFVSKETLWGDFSKKENVTFDHSGISNENFLEFEQKLFREVVKITINESREPFHEIFSSQKCSRSCGIRKSPKTEVELTRFYLSNGAKLLLIEDTMKKLIEDFVLEDFEKCHYRFL